MCQHVTYEDFFGRQLSLIVERGLAKKAYKRASLQWISMYKTVRQLIEWRGEEETLSSGSSWDKIAVLVKFEKKLVSMDAEKVFHMKGGDGNESYAKNSSIQRKALDMMKHITIFTITDLYMTISTTDSLSIADLGCSTGPNTFSVVRDIIQAVHETSCDILKRPTPEIMVYLNDLPTNDFNSIFICLPDFHKEIIGKGSSSSVPSVFIAGVPGSFHGRLFPGNSLHFIHSSQSLHWLSRVPPGLYDSEGNPINKGHIYISESNTAVVSKAYLSQFQADFSVFLQSRSEEVISGGRMVLILFGRKGPHHTERGLAFLWELFARCMVQMVSEGKVEEEKLDSYDIHLYNPSKDEIQDVVKKQGSFIIDQLEMFEIERISIDEDGPSYGTTMAMACRAIQEPMLRYHFGEGNFIDDLFDIYGKLLDEEMSKEEISLINFILVLRKSI